MSKLALAMSRLALAMSTQLSGLETEQLSIDSWLELSHLSGRMYVEEASSDIWLVTSNLDDELETEQPSHEDNNRVTVPLENTSNVATPAMFSDSDEDGTDSHDDEDYVVNSASDDSTDSDSDESSCFEGPI
jgi:hypothetical protein